MHNQVAKLINYYYVGHNSLNKIKINSLKVAQNEAIRNSFHYSKIYDQLYYDILKKRSIFNENIKLKNEHIYLKDENGHYNDVTPYLETYFKIPIYMFYKNNPKFLKSIWSAIHSINNSFFTSNFIYKKMPNLNLVVFYKTSSYGNITFNQIKNIKCIYFAPYDFNKDKFDSEFKISKKAISFLVR